MNRLAIPEEKENRGKSDGSMRSPSHLPPGTGQRILVLCYYPKKVIFISH